MLMTNRRQFLGAAAATLLPISLEAQTAAPAPPVAELARHALSGPLEGFEVVLVQLNSPPAAATRPAGPGHRHPGPVLAYVVEGQVRFAINNEPERVVSAGGTFFEPTGALHSAGGSATPNAPSRTVVFMLVPKGSPLTAPA